ncbi:MAG: prepilin-type N-terminal cleavage/methylation domain-containing protein [Rhodocyclaceae bacterium]
MCTKGQQSAFLQRGVTLIELVVFIVIISVGVVGLVSVTGPIVRSSADPMVRKQALAIAQSLLQEIEQQAFTFCDPQDANVLTALNGPACTNDQNKGGAAFPAPGSPAPTPAGETRGDAANPYDNVADYAGYQATGDVITGFAGLADYTASVSISRVGGAGAFAALPADAVLQIDVRVNGRNETVILTGFRVRYAPNAPG